MANPLQRMALLAFAAVLAGTVPATGAAPPKDSRPLLVLITIDGGHTFAPEQINAIEGLLLSALDRSGRFRVIGRSDIQSMLDLEARKQAAGCNEDTGCMKQIAGALGADYVGNAGIGLLGRTRILTFKVIDVRTGEGLVHARETVQSDDDLVRAVDSVTDQATAALSRMVPGAARPVALLPPATAPGHASVPAEALKPAPGKPLTTGQAWGIVSLTAAALIGGGSAAFDNLAPTSRDHKFEPVDVLPVVGYAVALSLGVVGIYELVKR